jgi:hypothetical protein
LLVAKPGHGSRSNGAEQVAAADRDSGIDVVDAGIRVTSGPRIAGRRAAGLRVLGLAVRVIHWKCLRPSPYSRPLVSATSTTMNPRCRPELVSVVAMACQSRSVSTQNGGYL